MVSKKEERSYVQLENGGQKIFGVWHAPYQACVSPAVIMCHGLAGNKIGRYRLYVILAQALAHLGIGVLRFDFRGAGDSEGEFSEMTVDSQVSDALVALDWVSKQPHIDVGRIGLFGRSFGGAVAVQAARRFGNVKSLALWAPVFDGRQWKTRWDSSQNAAESLPLINGQKGSLSLFEQLFKLDLAEELANLQHVALLHIYGQKDEILTAEHAEQYEVCRTGASAESQFLRYPHSDHDFTYLPERKTAIIETLKWFTHTLEVEHAQPFAKVADGLSTAVTESARTSGITDH